MPSQYLVVALIGRASQGMFFISQIITDRFTTIVPYQISKEKLQTDELNVTEEFLCNRLATSLKGGTFRILERDSAFRYRNEGDGGEI